MASKRKQDDKHLKLLREMVSREHNKTCFECSQRGPTYVDMTIGTFVCTACSGILRGINPPHRVKSISMASYTPAEIEFLEKNGNEVCRHIWLGLCNSSAQRGPESKEDSKVRDYLVQKYEKKRWYVEPGQAAVLAAAKAKEEIVEKKSTSSSHSTPEPKPLKSLVGNNAPPLKVSQPPGHSASAHNISKAPTLAQTANKQKSVDLLADLGADPFASSAQPGGFGQAPFGQPAQQTPFGQPAQQGAFGQQAAFGQPAQQGGFADFGQAFGGPAQTSQAFMPAPQAQTNQVAHPPAASPSNSFGAFESAFSPQQAAPAPAASSGAATLTPGLQGLSLKNSAAPPARPAASAGGDKYAAFASLGTVLGETTPSTSTIDWSGRAPPPGGIDWGSGGGGGGGGGGMVGLPTKSASSSSIDWGTGMAKSQPSQPAALGAGTMTTSSSAAFGSLAFGAGAAPSAAQGNPFMAMSSSGATPATSTMAANPFMAGGAPATSMGAPGAQANGLFGMQSAATAMPAQNPMMMAGVGGVGGGGGFNQVPGGMGGANMQMNGRVGAGFPPLQGQMAGAGGYAMQPAAMTNQFGMHAQMGVPAAQPQPVGAGMTFGAAGMATMAGLQFNKMAQPQPGMAGFAQMGAPQQPVPQAQQFQSWGAAPAAMPQQNTMAANPFMGGGFGQAPVPPKSNASNPFL